MTNAHRDVAGMMRTASQALVDAGSIRDVEQTVSDLVRVAVNTVPGATGGGVSRVHDGTVRSSHATSPVIETIADLQTTLRQGPCITAADDPPGDGMVHADDLRGQHDRDRWPSFAPQAADLGFRSLLAVGFRTGRGRFAALNLYAAEPGAFDREARLLAALFGSQAATLLYGAESASGLDRALRSRDLIGQAKGVLMERFDLDASTAFARLVAASQTTNVKLTAVAEWVVNEVEQRTEPAGHAVEHDPRLEHLR